MRDCENCKHRVMKVEVGKGTPPEHFWGCECWECEFEPTTKKDLAVDCVARQDVERYIEGFINEYTPRKELEFINLELDGLKHLPSVTPQEPKTGHWIIYNYPGHECVYCSSCKEEYYEDDLYLGGSDFPKYCPNCGCAMVESQESEDKECLI